MLSADAKYKTPKPDGQPGFIISVDPDRQSFKNAFIAIAFSAMYLEALCYIVALKRFDVQTASKIDRMNYEKRLPKLGITDAALIEQAKRFREARKDLVHEKAVEPIELGSQQIYTAQKVAAEAFSLVSTIKSILHVAP